MERTGRGKDGERQVRIPVGRVALEGDLGVPAGAGALVSPGGRPGLADEARPAVRAPTLLIVGGDDDVVIGLNEGALARLGAAVKRLVIVPRASHLFEEPGKLEEVARLAADWLGLHLRAAAPAGKVKAPLP